MHVCGLAKGDCWLCRVSTKEASPHLFRHLYMQAGLAFVLKVGALGLPLTHGCCDCRCSGNRMEVLPCLYASIRPASGLCSTSQ